MAQPPIFLSTIDSCEDKALIVVASFFSVSRSAFLMRCDMEVTDPEAQRARPLPGHKHPKGCAACLALSLALLALAVALVDAQGLPRGIRLRDIATVRHPLQPLLPSYYQPLVQPPERRSSNGLLNTTLRVNVKHVQGPGPLAYVARTYEGVPFGPTLRVRAGDTLAFTLVNQLAPDGPTTPGPFSLRHPNTTNIHLHGLHVSPSGIADNVFRMVAPGTSARSVYRIPPNHPPGVFYYHPHYEGSTLLQTMASMAGFLVVEDPKESPPELTRMREFLLGVQEIRVSGSKLSSYVVASHRAHSTLPLHLKQVLRIHRQWKQSPHMRT